jgi:hypothetical protein
MVELVALSPSRSAIADAQAEQKDQDKGAHPEWCIGGHSFLCRRPACDCPPPRTFCIKSAANPVAAAGRRGSAYRAG